MYIPLTACWYAFVRMPASYPCESLCGRRLVWHLWSSRNIDGWSDIQEALFIHNQRLQGRCSLMRVWRSWQQRWHLWTNVPANSMCCGGSESLDGGIKLQGRCSGWGWGGGAVRLFVWSLGRSPPPWREQTAFPAFTRRLLGAGRGVHTQAARSAAWSTTMETGSLMGSRGTEQGGGGSLLTSQWRHHRFGGGGETAARC